MAELLSVATPATPLPTPADIARAERFVRERFVHEGEDAEVALAPSSARRRALDAALAELARGHEHPSTEWRRSWSLLLGLERLLSEEQPHLADGTLLNPHQVDALSGTLTALLADAQREANGNGAAQNGAPEPVPVSAPPLEGSPAVPGEEEVDDELPDDEEPQDWEEEAPEGFEDDELPDAPEDPNAHKRFWFEHATGAGKSVAALGFVEASRTGGVLILTHRRNLVEQFEGELRDRGYRDRITRALMKGEDRWEGPVTVETYQWFVRHAGEISSAYTIVICDEAHTALGEKTSATIREWTGPIFIGMTATGALIARHVTDLFPTQTSRFDLAQAARRGVIAPLRCVRIPPGPGVRTIAKVPLRKGDVDVEFDQELLAELLDQLPFNLAIANLYKTRFDGVPGVVYAAGVRHAYNVAQAFRDEGLKAMAVSGETPKRELADILARYERGDIDVLVNAQLLAEGWNSPRATVCMHLAPTASRRIYQQRVGRVTRRHPGKESGVVVDFVHPATKHDDPVVTLHSLLDRDVYRGGAIVVGPVRRGRGRRVRVERRVLPVTGDEERRIEVFERELWRIAVEHLDYGEQVQWAALAGARVSPSGWRRARAMLHFDKGGELKRAFLLTAVQRNKNPQLRVRALQEIAAARDAEAFDFALDEIERWPKAEKHEAVKIALQALAENRIGRRDQANAWIWRLAEDTREVHEEYAVQRWPETKRLLGLLVNSSGGAHARNARRLVQAARKQDRRLQAALLAAARGHSPEAEEVLRGARTRLARKPSALSRDLLRNFPKKRVRANRRRRRKGEGADAGAVEAIGSAARLLAGAREGPDGDVDLVEDEDAVLLDEDGEGFDDAEPAEAVPLEDADDEVVEVDASEDADAGAGAVAASNAAEAETPRPARRRRRRRTRAAAAAESDPGEGSTPPHGDPLVQDDDAPVVDPGEEPEPDEGTGTPPHGDPLEEDAEERAAAEAPKPRRRRRAATPAPTTAPEPAVVLVEGGASEPSEAAGEPKPRRRRAGAAEGPVEDGASAGEGKAGPKPRRRRARTGAELAAENGASAEAAEDTATPRRHRPRTEAKTPAEHAAGAQPAEDTAPPRRRRTRAAAMPVDAPGEAPPEGEVSPVVEAPVAAGDAPRRPRRSRARPAALGEQPEEPAA